MKVIGLHGKAGSGKDTVADYLVANHGFEKISFAMTLKAMLAAGGFPEPANRDDKESLVVGFDFSWRKAAQYLGTEFGRALDKDIWVKCTEKLLQPDGKYVFSDVRFDNEADMIRKYGKVWHIEGRAVNLGEMAYHASESGITGTQHDFYLYNDGTLDDLYMLTEEILSIDE